MPAKKKASGRKAASARPSAKKTGAARKVVAKASKKAASKSAKKAVAGKAAAVKAVAKKPEPKKVSLKSLGALKKALTKAEIMAQIADMAALTRKDVSNVFEALNFVVDGHVKKGAAGECTIPGLMKIRIIQKPATKARKGINPFTGQETMFKAKPARRVVKIRPLKKLKEMAE